MRLRPSTPDQQTDESRSTVRVEIVFIDDFLSSGLWGLQEGKGLVLPIPHEFGASRLMPQVIQAGVESV